jgi:predicted RNA-binding Zn ribbon-like protein
MSIVGAVPERAWVLPGEPLPVRLMSTIWAGADGRHDDLLTAADVDEWLDAVGIDRAGAHTTERELARARMLRAAVRELAGYLTRDSRSAAPVLAGVTAAVGRLNAAAAELPVPRLALREGRLERGTAAAGSPVTAGLAHVAELTIGLLGGPAAGELRACYAPGCVLYFIKTHPRREWCSVACGNRARAARHYQKVREHRSEAGRAG